MAELFKNVYTPAFVHEFAERVQKVYQKFEVRNFTTAVFSPEWENMELKQRMRQLSTTLGACLPMPYSEQVNCVVQVVHQLLSDGENEASVEYMFLPDFVEVFGLKALDDSVAAMEQITQFTSCEFCVRPFLLKYPDKMLAQMLAWTEHANPWVRRLASEGSRPRLPWAMALPAFKQNPRALLPILERLKDDKAETVRRSVANHVNDIAKDNPEVSIALAMAWWGQTKTLDWVVKHSARTLLKKGEPRLMKLFGYGSPADFEVMEFGLTRNQIALGDFIEFSFELKNTSQKPSKLRLEYAIYYQKANRSLSPKVYKISERTYHPSEHQTIVRKQAFKPISTRKFHAGRHAVALVINGEERERLYFDFVQ